MSPQGTNFKSKYKLRAHGKVLSLARPVVMGIINLTPDSFYDGGSLYSGEDILCRADKHLAGGAAILDLGAVSTKPGAAEVDEEEELRRLLPALKLLRNSFPGVFISVDTFRASVALAAAEEGADIINDISGGTFDTDMFATVAKTKLPYVIMHIQGTPKIMQVNPHYKNVLKEVFDFLHTQAKRAERAGVKQIIIDPGFGFGKTVEHNFSLLHELNKFEKLKKPILAGLSRKSLVNKTLGAKAAEGLNGTTVVNTLALLKGANILRVHDAKEAAEAIKLCQAYGLAKK
jgi:dihydropteroate synthase